MEKRELLQWEEICHKKTLASESALMKKQ